MTITGYRKVHIVMPGLEVVRVTKPLRHIGCERLIIFGNPKKDDRRTKVYYEYNEEIRRQLKDLLKETAIENVDVNLYDFEKLLSQLCKIIREEKEKHNMVFVNVSCGSKIFVSAALMACMMYGAVPYFAERVGFRTRLNDLLEDGRPAGIAIDVKDPIEIPIFPLPPPEPALITVLSIIKELAGKNKFVRQGDIIKELASREIMADVYIKEKPSAKKKTVMGEKKVSRKALGEFKTMYFNKLLNDGWVTTKGYGRRVEVSLTEKGDQMLRIFSYK